MAKRNSSQISNVGNERSSKRRQGHAANVLRDLPSSEVEADEVANGVSLSDDTPNSDTSTVDQEATDGLLLTEENSVSDSNVNSCLSSTERSKEWRDSLADVWDSKKRQDDQCFDDGILDPLLSEIDPPLKESLPPLSRRPFRQWDGAYEGYVGLIIGDALEDRSGDPRSKFTPELIRSLYLYEGVGRIVNYINVDPLRMCTRESRSSQGKITLCLGVKQHPHGHPLYPSEEPRLAQLVSLAVVTASFLTTPLENRRGSKILFAQTPAMFTDRLMSIVHIGFGRFSEKSLFRAQITTNMGFEFSTRADATTSDYAKPNTFRTIASTVRSNRFKPVLRTKPDFPTVTSSRSSEENAYSLPSTSKVPVYDGRYTSMNLKSEKPFEGLPLFEGELASDDVVWIGFHSHCYKSQGHDFVSFNVAWVVLLHHQPVTVQGSG